MQIFALETNMELLKRRLVPSEKERILLTVRFHGFLFFVRIARQLLVTLLFVLAGAACVYVGFPALIITLVLGAVWFVVSFLKMVNAFIDWRYDVIILTTEKIIVVNQTSIFRQEVRQMNLDNIASVTAQTQMANLFPFGIICFDLKEGTGQTLRLSYIPYAERVATAIADVVNGYEHRLEADMPAPQTGV